MKTTTRKTESVMGKDLRMGDVVIRGGYEWVPVCTASHNDSLFWKWG